MKNQPAMAAALLASLTLAACGGSKTPSGQVVATVDKEEVTAIDLRNELGGFNPPDAATRKLAEQRALDQIVTRKLLAQAAEKAKIDKTPEFAQQEARMREALLVQLWQNQIAKAVPQPANDEAQRFVNEHPELYANRQILVGTQIRTGALPPAVVQQMQPLKTLPEIEALLTANKVRFQKGNFRFDPLSTDPRLSSQIAKLPMGEVFVVPTGQFLAISQASSTEPAPFTGPQALQHATQVLKVQRTQEAVQRQFGSVVSQGKAKVEYAKAYKPAPPAKAAPKAGAAPAAKPAAAPAAN